MIRRLRIKFVAIIMVLIGLVLFAALFGIGYFNARQQREEIEDAMRYMLDRDEGKGPQRHVIGNDKPPETGSLIPIFTVWLDGSGAIRSIDRGYVDIEDALIEQAVQAAQAKPQNEGVIAEPNLRYMRRQTPDGTKLVFTDRGAEQAALRQLALTLVLAGAGALLALFLVSVFLARWALRPVQEAWTRQQQFIADASHELKTPLTVIMANQNILLGRPDRTVGEERQWIDNTQAEAGRMKRLVEQMLFLAKSDAGQAPVQRAVFSLSDAVWACMLPFEPVAYERKIALTSEIALDVRMVGDEAQIKQLIVILLDNAMKFAGKDGSIWLDLKKEQDRIRLSVSNSGAAIAPDVLPHIFERFYQGDRARAQEGYGLGLSIAAKIVEAHGGKITVASDAQQGTVFTVRLRAA